jgi:hypothetical protein
MESNQLSGKVQSDSVDPVGAAFSTACRHIAVVPIWLLRLPFSPVADVPASLVVVVLDATLAVLYFCWVNKPLERVVGERFVRVLA